MARFRNSNRQAAAQMAYVARGRPHASRKPAAEQPYFRRIGFDFAML